MNRSNLDLETGVILIMVAMFEELGSGQPRQELCVNSSSMKERRGSPSKFWASFWNVGIS